MSEDSKKEVKLTDEQKEIVREIARQAKDMGLDVRFAMSLANMESAFRHVPADDETSTSFGPFQVNKATAKANDVDYEEMKNDPKLAIRAGLLNIVRHANNPDLRTYNPETQQYEIDPMRIAAAHRYGENSEYAKTGDPSSIDPTLRSYLKDVAHHFPDGTLPDSIYTKPTEQVSSPAPAASSEEDQQVDTGKPYQQKELPLPVQSAILGGAGAAAGAAFGSAHPVAAWVYDKAFGHGEEPQIKKETTVKPGATVGETSAWPGEKTPSLAEVNAQKEAEAIAQAEKKYTRAEKQRLGVGDKSGMTGRESQQGYLETTGQQAARRKLNEQNLKSVGLDVNKPFAEHPNVASTPYGTLVSESTLDQINAQQESQKQLAIQRELNRQKTQQILAQRAANKVGSEYQRLLNQGLTWSSSSNPTLRQWGRELLDKFGSMASKAGKTLPGKTAQFGFGAGTAIPYSVELWRNDHPYLAAALPALTGAAAVKAPKTYGALTAAGALMGAGYAAAHPLEYAKQMKTSDFVDPTVAMYMTGQELDEPAIPELQDEQLRAGAGRGFINPPLARP